MLKFVIFACLCAFVLVHGQDMPPPPPPPPDMKAPPMKAEHSRVVRQAMPQPPSASSMQDSMGGNPGNMAMQGLGNIPDPTAVIAKAQEVGRQFMSGRRRREAGPPHPNGPPPPPPPSAAAKVNVA